MFLTLILLSAFTVACGHTPQRISKKSWVIEEDPADANKICMDKLSRAVKCEKIKYFYKINEKGEKKKLTIKMSLGDRY